jgi:hypothetical protein
MVMTVNSKMTALADEIRELSGATEALSIDAMTTNVSDANDEVNNQTDLIAQIKGVIDTLPEAGNGNCEMISVNIDRFSNTLYYIDSSYSIQPAAPDTTIEALHGLILYNGGYELKGVSGDFIKTQSSLYQLLKFNYNGGVAQAVMPGNGGAEN